LFEADEKREKRRGPKKERGTVTSPEEKVENEGGSPTAKGEKGGTPPTEKKGGGVLFVGEKRVRGKRKMQVNSLSPLGGKKGNGTQKRKRKTSPRSLRRPKREEKTENKPGKKRETFRLFFPSGKKKKKKKECHGIWEKREKGVS